MAANGRRPVDQVDFKTSRSKIQSGLNTAHPSANHHDIPKLTSFETFAKLFHLSFFHFQIRNPQPVTRNSLLTGLYHLQENLRYVFNRYGLMILQG